MLQELRRGADRAIIYNVWCVRALGSLEYISRLVFDCPTNDILDWWTCARSFDHDCEFLAVSSDKGTIHVFKIGATGASMDKGSAGRKGGKKKGKDENSKSRYVLWVTVVSGLQVRDANNPRTSR